MKRAGLYVHIPFCKRRCGYCHFMTTVGMEQEPYVAALTTEIHEISRRCDLDDLTFDSIYFGGGTPSVLRIDLFESILCALRRSFLVVANAEVTIEANPDPDANLVANAAFYAGWGVNRVSLGVQSAVPEELAALDRLHQPEDVVEAVGALHPHIDNINVDFMLGIPGQTPERLQRSLDLIPELSPAHVSIYVLEVFPDTPLGRASYAPDDELVADLYGQACRFLASEGYLHYEICNFARPGRECRHNLKYWDGSIYVGVGASAASFDGRRRWTNTDDLPRYVADPSSGRIEVVLDPDTISREALFLGLRTSGGIDRSAFESAHGYDPGVRFRKDLEELIEAGLVIADGTRYRIPEEKMLLGNEVFGRFI